MEFILLSCKAQVGGETVTVQVEVAPHAYDDPEARRFAEECLRMALMEKIVERFPPEISVRRVSDPFGRAR